MIVTRIDGVVEAMAASFSRTVQHLEVGQTSALPIEKLGQNFGPLGSDNPAPEPAPDANQAKLDL
jgi:hypothetical protein